MDVWWEDVNCVSLALNNNLQFQSRSFLHPVPGHVHVLDIILKGKAHIRL